MTSNSRDPRPAMHFEDENFKEVPPDAADPRPGLRFDAELESRALVSQEPEQDSTHAPLEKVLSRPRKRRWGLLAVLGGALGLGTAELVTGLPATLVGGDWLATGWQVLGLGVITLGATSLTRELFRLRRLKNHDQLREQLSELPQLSPHAASSLVQRLKQQLAMADDDPHWQAFEAAREAHHDGQDISSLVEHHLLAPRDREARRLISRMSGETAVMVAVSPMTLVDMALVAWRHLAMIDRLCRLYGLELGYGARVRLLRSVLYQMAFAGATELAADASMQMLSLDLAGRLSTRAAQGLGVGLLGARLGLRTQRLVRPLAFASEDRPRLTDLRKEVWQQLRRMEPSGGERS
ncbi:YcjF family protein [Halomonas huangheensis]|nr:TIGR01620 family protein [Halomonas huangheensis]